MRFHPELHLRQMAGRLHWPHWSHLPQEAKETRETPKPHAARSQAHWHSLQEDAEVAKATLYVSAVTLVILLVVLAAIAFGQEALHWLGVH
ncbi:hypothetical protein ACKI2N_018605 [Cupriavidus sp. 30B13]|uniref:hypothetical protein n=1 Tax=Cupriavidus sp. 30B13 TaxID=3384241 RepID=UPI003B8EB5C9